MACPPPKKIRAALTVGCDEPSGPIFEALGKNWDALALAYCTSTGNPECSVMNVESLTIPVSVPIGKSGKCRYVFEAEASCGEPSKPWWEIVLDAVKKGTGLVTVIVAALAVPLVIEITAAFAAKLAADPQGAENLTRVLQGMAK